MLVSREGELLNDSPGEFIKTALQNEAMSFRPDVPSQRIVFEVPVSFVRKKTRVFCRQVVFPRVGYIAQQKVCFICLGRWHKDTVDVARTGRGNSHPQR